MIGKTHALNVLISTENSLLSMQIPHLVTCITIYYTLAKHLLTAPNNCNQIESEEKPFSSVSFYQCIT